MIMFWNRKEIYVGHSMQEFNRIRDALNTNRIKYEYRIINQSSSRARFGTFNENMEYTRLYYLYVHKGNYEEAYNLLFNH